MAETFGGKEGVAIPGSESKREKFEPYTGPLLSSKLGTEPDSWYTESHSKAVSASPFLGQEKKRAF